MLKSLIKWIDVQKKYNIYIYKYNKIYLTNITHKTEYVLILTSIYNNNNVIIIIICLLFPSAN